MRKGLIAIAISTVLIGSTVTAGYTYNVDRIYPQTMVVTKVNYKTDTVVAKTFSGIKHKFKGCEDWMIGDICSAIMDNRNTSTVYDDKVLKVKYSGYVEE